MANSGKILVTGAFGQIGSDLIPALRKKYARQNVVALAHKNIPDDFEGLVERADINDIDELARIIKKHKIGSVYHLVAILSAIGEKDPQLTWKVNMGGLKNILDLAKDLKLKVFWPSTIAAFGPTTPKVKTPQETVMEPTTMYGVTKVAGENLCHYYNLKYGVDVRSVRFPGVISWKTPPGGGTSDYAVAIFYEALQKGKYECFVKKETMIPMIYMDDAVRSAIEIMTADNKKIKIRNSYNITGASFTAGQLADEVKKHVKLTINYKPDFRQKIADTWPKSLDDSRAHADWGWEPYFDLKTLTLEMISKLNQKLAGDK